MQALGGGSGKVEEEGEEGRLCPSLVLNYSWMTAAHHNLVLCVATCSSQCVVQWDVATDKVCRVYIVDTV